IDWLSMTMTEWRRRPLALLSPGSPTTAARVPATLAAQAQLPPPKIMVPRRKPLSTSFLAAGSKLSFHCPEYLVVVAVTVVIVVVVVLFLLRLLRPAGRSRHPLAGRRRFFGFVC